MPWVLKYLKEVEKDVVTNAESFLNAPGERFGDSGAIEPEEGPSAFLRYRVNLIIDHSESKNAPVIYEDEPTFER